MKKKLLGIFLVCVLVAGAAFAQDKRITGKVTASEDGLPLPGVSVKVTGTTIGTQTDANGNYALNVPATGKSLSFSFIGFTNQVVTIGTKTVVSISLETDKKQLSEVVVVGYGTQLKRDVTGSSGSVKGSEISNLATPSFDRALAGRVAGVQVITPSGQLGQPAQIRIRGVNSISSGTAPLYVIDGVPAYSGDTGGFTSSNALADINPNDIESFEILKDGAATAIYGSRASNGVILITTKRGKAGKTIFTYDGFYAAAKNSSRFDLLNAEEFIAVSNERLVNSGNAPQAFPTPDGNGGFVDTDWQSFLFRNSTQQSHTVSANGGTESAKFYFSLGYSDQDGILEANSLKRYSLKANYDQKVNKYLNFGITSGLTYQDNRGSTIGSNALSGNIFGGTRMLPNVSVYNPADPTGYNIDADRVTVGRGSNTISISDNIPNQRFVIDKNIRKAISYRALASTYMEVLITTGLKFKTQLGIDAQYNDDFTFNDPRHGDSRGANGTSSQAFTPSFRWNLQNILSYNKSFNKIHNFDVTLVNEYQKDRTSFYQANISNITDIYWNQNITTGTFVTPTVNGGASQFALESYLARLNYNYKNKYYIGASIRQDSNSDLPKEYRKGYFPGVSVAYRVSEESFFKNATGLNFMSDLRIRGSFAEVGNIAIGRFRYLGQYSAAVYGGQSGTGFSNIGNPNLRWEQQKKYDAGLEAGFLGGKINITADYFRQDNDRIVLSAPTAPSLGVPGNSITQNVGNIRNQGFEFSISADPVRQNNFSWNTSFNVTTQKNKVLALFNNEDQIGAYNIVRVGESINALYGYQYLGVNAANGNPLYQKANGTVIQGNIANQAYFTYDPANPNQIYNSSLPISASNPDNRATLASTDRTVLGDVLPKWFGGFSNTFTYKSLDLNVFLRFQGGNKIYNRTRVDLVNQNFVNNGTEILGRWQSVANPGDGQTPRQFFERSTFINLDNQAYTRFVEKGDFLRLDNVSLGYKIPAKALNRLSIGSARLFVTAQNLFVITGYKGLDPETNTNGAGVDFNGNPQQRTFTFGINLGI